MEKNNITFKGLAFDYKKYLLINKYFNFQQNDIDKFYNNLENYYNNYDSCYINRKSFTDYLFKSINTKYQISLIDTISKLLPKNKYNFILHSIIAHAEINSPKNFEKYKQKNLLYFIYYFIFELFKIPISIVFLSYKWIIYKLFFKKTIIQNIKSLKVILIGGTNGIGYCLGNIIADHDIDVTIFSQDINKINNIKDILYKKNILKKLIYRHLDLTNETDYYQKIVKELKNHKDIVIIYNAAIKSSNLRITNNVNYEQNINLMNKINNSFIKKNKTIKHVFISSRGKNLESYNYPFYNSSKAALSSIIRSYQLIYSDSKNINFTLIEPGLINTKLIKSTNLTNLFSIEPDVASNYIFNNIFFNNKKYLLVGKRYIIIDIILRLLPYKFKIFILKNYSSEYVSK